MPDIARVESDTKRECGLAGSAIYDLRRLTERWDGYVRGTRHPQQAEAPRVLYAAIADERMVGFIAGHFSRRYDTQAELQSIHVLKQHQGCGIGSALLRHLASWFVEHNRMRICVGIDPDNPYRRYYAKHGARVLNDHWFVWDDISIVLP